MGGREGSGFEGMVDTWITIMRCCLSLSIAAATVL